MKGFPTPPAPSKGPRCSPGPLLLFAVLGLPLSGLPALTWDSSLFLEAEVRAGHLSADSAWSTCGGQSLADLGANARWMTRLEQDRTSFEFHLDLTATVGDTRERMLAAGFENGAAGSGRGNGISATNDARRLLDLTWTVSEGTRHLDTARVDRLALTLSPPWGTVRIGRQALTWGGGLTFNPFDLFNPFAPGDVARDFKTGDDMIFVDLSRDEGGLQCLAVVRRGPEAGSIASDQASLAVHYQAFRGSGEVFALAAWHYDQPVIGAGASGLLGQAGWRIDATWNRIQSDFGPNSSDAFALVANLHYSWIWGGRNLYGFLEYYHNSLGQTDYAAALEDPFILTTIGRGNLFTLGSHYAVVSVQVEWHPLVNLFFSAVTNLEDPSALLQPRLTWDASQEFRLTIGMDVPTGGSGTEFGGFTRGDQAGTTRGPISAYCWGSWYF